MKKFGLAIEITKELLRVEAINLKQYKDIETLEKIMKCFAKSIFDKSEQIDNLELDLKKEKELVKIANERIEAKDKKIDVLKESNINWQKSCIAARTKLEKYETTL